MKNYRYPNVEQRVFLKQSGLNPKDFLLVNKAYDHYTFYHIKKGKEVSLRR
ncbi:DUF6906 family protein [Clostridium tertium]